MAKSKSMSINKASSFMDLPAPTKEARQRSITISDLFLTRFMPPWSRPPTLPAYTWRAWVLNQPVATDAKEFLISSLLSLDWKITPRNSKYQEELEATIKYYTDLFTKGGKYDELGLDYAGLVEWIAGDLLDTPFGGAAEVGRRNDEPGGRVVWLRPLDSGTLYPTLNKDFPVVQYYQGWDAVAFPNYAIARTYMSPQPYLWREGWGMAPPEKAYFALELLGRGDKYYANLLLDIPTAGILDLADMEKTSAEEWVEAFKTFVNDQSQSFRIPVLYEHNNEVKFIPFGKVPNDIMFDKITHKYAALLCAAYGISASDIGLSTTTSSGETLAGSIRSQRQTKITGRARLKAKMKAFFDTILPSSLEFNYIDYDTEDMINLGKARLASASALQIFKDKGAISPQEFRSQIIQDGLMTINMPDELPPDAKELLPQPGGFGGKNPKEPELVGDKKNPSQGGEGEIKRVSYIVDQMKLNSLVARSVELYFPEFYYRALATAEDNLLVERSQAVDEILSAETMYGFNAEDAVTFSVEDDTESIAQTLKSGVSNVVTKAILVSLMNTLFVEDDISEMRVEDEMQNVKSLVAKSLGSYLDAYIYDVVVHHIVYPPIQEPIIEKSEPTYVQPTLPNITVNMSLPERSTTVHVPPTVVNVERSNPVVNVDVEIPETPAPQVHITVPPSNVTIEPAEVIVNNDAPIVNVSVPENPIMPAPTVNVINQVDVPQVNVDVSPTPVNVEVEVPKESHRIQYVHRDGRGEIDYTETDIVYEEDDDEKESDEE